MDFNCDRLKHGAIWQPGRSGEGHERFVLLALHGSGGAGSDFLGLDEELHLQNFDYLYPNGPITTYSTYRWYSDPYELSEATDLLDRVFEQLFGLGVAPDQIVMMGFSQGAAMVFEYGARAPFVLGGYVSISGRVENLPLLLSQANPDLIRRGRWLATHGTHDQTLSIAIAKNQVEQMRSCGFNIDFEEFEKGHTFDAKRELPLISRWIKSLPTVKEAL